MKPQIFSVALLLLANPLFAQETLGVHVTPFEEAPALGEFTSVSTRMMDSIKDLNNALGDHFRLVSREDADFVVWVSKDPSSSLPSTDRTIISDSGDRIIVDRQTTSFIPIRQMTAYLMVPGTDYREHFIGTSTMRWRAAAGKVASEIVAWVEQNESTLRLYRESSPEYRVSVSNLSVRDTVRYRTVIGGTITNTGTAHIGPFSKIAARFYGADGRPTYASGGMSLGDFKSGLPVGSQQHFEFYVSGASGWNYFTLDILNRDDRDISCIGECGRSVLDDLKVELSDIRIKYRNFFGSISTNVIGSVSNVGPVTMDDHDWNLRARFYAEDGTLLADEGTAGTRTIPPGLWQEFEISFTDEPLAKLPGDWGWAQSSALLVNTIALDRRLDILSG